MKTQRWLVVAGAIAAIVGGLCWAVKAAAIMLTTVQPPVIYEVAPLFFPLAVVGLRALLDDTVSRLAISGVAVAGAAELAAAIAAFGLFFGPADWRPTGDTVTVLTPFITFASLGWLLGLLLVGIVVRRTHALPGWWAVLPMFLALTAVPLIALGPPLQALNERLSELPTLVIGCEWIALGVVLGSRRVPNRMTAHLQV